MLIVFYQRLERYEAIVSLHDIAYSGGPDARGYYSRVSDGNAHRAEKRRSAIDPWSWEIVFRSVKG